MWVFRINTYYFQLANPSARKYIKVFEFDIQTNTIGKQIDLIVTNNVIQTIDDFYCECYKWYMDIPTARWLKTILL